MTEQFKKIPAVGDAIHWPQISEHLLVHPRSLVVRAIAQSAEQLRDAIKKGHSIDTSVPAFSDRVTQTLLRISAPKLRKVVNATGVIVHTNLGRSALAKEAVKAVSQIASSYSTLEYSLDTKSRGSRNSLVSDLLCELTGAPAAMAVNNNAAAVFLALNSIAQGREVIVSRGELVEIGGSFRVPDVMEKSGCRLVEVGTTNKTHPKDYRNALTDQTALILKVHTSNYRIMGFSSSVPGAELTQIGHALGIPVMEDLGSGFLSGPDVLDLPDEPSIQDVVSSDMDVITFSGDKLLGGPQAGIILGKPEWIEAISQNPIARAVRLDKMTLAALESTLSIYRDPERAKKTIPTLKMAGYSQKILREKARRLALEIRKKAGDYAEVGVVSTVARVGGGSLPMLSLPSAAVSITPKAFSVEKLDSILHNQEIPIIGRIEDNKYLLDVRTLLDGESKIVQNVLCEVLQADEASG